MFPSLRKFADLTLPGRESFPPNIQIAGGGGKQHTDLLHLMKVSLTIPIKSQIYICEYVYINKYTFNHCFTIYN